MRCEVCSQCAAFAVSPKFSGFFGRSLLTCSGRPGFEMLGLRSLVPGLSRRALSIRNITEASATANKNGQEKRRHQMSARRISNASRLRPSMRPKQSLGQNFLVDLNMIRKIVNAVPTPQNDERGRSVVEVGPGMGALTVPLLEKFPEMVAVEIDGRAVEHLNTTYPSLDVIYGDVLDVNWKEMCKERGGIPLTVVGNLPYNVVSQIVFSLLESPGSVRDGLFMMQKEVAERVIAETRTKAYGILSVIAQLYAKPKILFNVPNTVFYPKPDITSAMVEFDFVQHPELDMTNEVLTGGLRQVVRQSFQQRRKTLRNSLKNLLNKQESPALPDLWAPKRPEELKPVEFLDLTKFVYKRELEARQTKIREKDVNGSNEETQPGKDDISPVWRTRGTHLFREQGVSASAPPL